MRRILAGAAIGAVLGLALATPAYANTEQVSHEWDVASKGAAGWSCPAGTSPVASSVVVTAEHEVPTSAPMVPDTQYPHYKTGPAETGWYVVNGDTPQHIKLEFDCAAAASPTPSSTTAAPKPPAAPKKCEAYRYTGTTQNLCAAGLPETGKVNCSDVKYRVTLVSAANDPWGLDGNRGTRGVGCESNPLKPKPAASKSTAAAGAGGGNAAALPVTGAPIKLVGGIAVGGLALGGLALLVSRRRRTRFTA